jgi:hypothetical protein
MITLEEVDLMWLENLNDLSYIHIYRRIKQHIQRLLEFWVLTILIKNTSDPLEGARLIWINICSLLSLLLFYIYAYN